MATSVPTEERSTDDGMPLPPAVERAGVEPGWWVTSVRHGSPVAHRLARSERGPRSGSERAVCGRRVQRPQRLPDDATGSACRDCVTKAARALPPGRVASVVGPAPSLRRVPQARTGELVNTAAARIRRRDGIRHAFDLSDRVYRYQPQPYGEVRAGAVCVLFPDWVPLTACGEDPMPDLVPEAVPDAVPAS